MGIVQSRTSAYGKELARWDTPRNKRVLDEEGNETDVMGMGAIGHEPFPAMLYKAHRRENGKVQCFDLDAVYAVDVAVQAKAEAFNRTCEKTVGNQQEYDRARDEGWRESPAAALAYYEALQQDIATAAAEAAHAVQRMSDKAKAEHAAADASTDAPVTDVPAPAKKRGRQPNAPMVTVS